MKMVAKSKLKVLFYSVFFLCLGALTFPISADDSDAKIDIYVDADFSNHRESSESIVRGIETAFSFIGNEIQGRRVHLIRKDHRGNSARSLRNIKSYLADRYALAIFSGVHSPPLLAHREFINKNGVLFLDPWAAAGPITRYPSPENWIYRLSLDDRKAGKVIASFAVDVKKTQRPFLILEKTGWGKSNERTMLASLRSLDIVPAGIARFDWGIKQAGAKALVMQAVEAEADAIFLVANSVEGSLIVQAMVDLNPALRIPIVSHWGITAGDFHKKVPYENRKKVDLTFIQTSFSFVGRELTPYQEKVFKQVQKLTPSIKKVEDILSPTGFIHAYDLTKLFIEALKQTSLTDNINQNRKLLRSALENINQPVTGLIKTYHKPFSVFSLDNIDAHEALRSQDYVMASFGKKGEIILHPWRFKELM